MKRYLVFCKDQKQWDDYTKTHELCIKQSGIFTIDVRDNSFILTNKRDGKQYVYTKMIPCKNYRKSFSLGYGILSEKIWLCDENEFVDLAWVDKYL